MHLVHAFEMRAGSILAILRIQLCTLFCSIIDSLSREDQLDLFAWGRSGGEAEE
jgi:hypothetical protein